MRPGPRIKTYIWEVLFLSEGNLDHPHSDIPQVNWLKLGGSISQIDNEVGHSGDPGSDLHTFNTTLNFQGPVEG